MPTPHISPWGPPLPAAVCSPQALSAARRRGGDPDDSLTTVSPQSHHKLPSVTTTPSRRRRRNGSPNASSTKNSNRLRSAELKIQAAKALELPFEPPDEVSPTPGSTKPGRYEWNLRRSKVAGAGILHSWDTIGLVSQSSNLMTLRGYYRQLRQNDRARFDALCVPVTMDHVKEIKIARDEKHLAESRAELDSYRAKRLEVLAEERKRVQQLANISLVETEPGGPNPPDFPELSPIRGRSDQPGGGDNNFADKQIEVVAAPKNPLGLAEQARQRTAATTMQAAQRGRAVRNRQRSAQTRDAFDEEVALACLKIQSVQRGRQGRKEAARLRQQSSRDAA